MKNKMLHSHKFKHMPETLQQGKNYRVSLELKFNGNIISDRAFNNVGINNTNPAAVSFDYAGASSGPIVKLSVALNATGSGILNVTADCTYNKTNGDNVTESAVATMQYTVTTAPDTAELILVLEQI